MFLGGYFLWILDVHFCSQVRRWRRTIGLPWAVLFEGHAWWHLMTGLGTYSRTPWEVLKLMRYLLGGNVVRVLVFLIDRRGSG